MAKKLGLVDLMESLGKEKFEERIVKLIKEKDENKPHLHPEDFSLRELYRVCFGADITSDIIMEAVDPDMFPTITGELISKKVIDAYESAVVVANELVTDVPSTKEVEKITGFTGVGYMEKIPAGMDYPEHGFGDKYVTVSNYKYGDILNITEEAIIFDQTGQMLARAARLGDAAAQYKEKLILNTVQDITGFKSFYPAGTQTDIWATTAGTTILYPTIKDNNPLADETDITAALLLLAAMKDDSPTKNPIVTKPTHLLTPIALESVALKLFNSTVTLAATATAGLPNIYKGRYKVVSSPYLDAQSAAIWYIGNFKKQYVWQNVIPLQVLRGIAGNVEEFNRDIKARFKVRFFGGCGATDFRHCIQNT